MTQEKFAFGDQVRHPTRPEWGEGSVTKVESVTVDGRPAQRLSVRFPGQGVKMLNTGYVDLVRGGSAGSGPGSDILGNADRQEAPAAAVIRALANEGDWLAEVNVRKIEEAMRELPEAACDPFASPQRRLEATLALYRFARTGHGLVAWAVAQTGLEDPLTRFNRHELEHFFDRWATERDAHLSRLIAESGFTGRELDELMAKAPPAALRAAGRRAPASR